MSAALTIPSHHMPPFLKVPHLTHTHLKGTHQLSSSLSFLAASSSLLRPVGFQVQPEEVPPLPWLFFWVTVVGCFGIMVDGTRIALRENSDKKHESIWFGEWIHTSQLSWRGRLSQEMPHHLLLKPTLAPPPNQRLLKPSAGAASGSGIFRRHHTPGTLPYPSLPLLLLLIPLLPSCTIVLPPDCKFRSQLWQTSPSGEFLVTNLPVSLLDILRATSGSALCRNFLGKTSMKFSFYMRALVSP